MYFVGEAEPLRRAASTPCFPMSLITPSDVETCRCLYQSKERRCDLIKLCIL